MTGTLISALVFIDGDQGTTGLQIRERLAPRRDIRLLTLPDHRRKDPGARAEALQRADLAILCLPDAAAREAVTLAGASGVRLIDASSAHRIDPAWTYGLPELVAGQAGRIAASARVSNPGCYPTGALLLLRPLVDAGLVPADLSVSIHAISGYSGQGRQGIVRHEGAEAATAPALQLYALELQHKHVPEICQHARLQRRPIFVPAYGHYRQGIVLTIPLHRESLPDAASAARLQAALADHHAGQPQVQVAVPTPGGGSATLDPQALNGTDAIRLQVLASPDGDQILLAAVFDNLGKGAAGAAVRNLDLMLYGGRIE
ncbi:MAG: N-acetyl-gamma-glutamyl-phosphate reductase [Lautropia sp.]